MKSRRKKYSKIVFLLGIILCTLGITFISLKCICNLSINLQEKEAIKKYYIPVSNTINNKTKVIKNEKKEIIYIGILRIPKIKLKRGLVEKNNYLNDVKYNVEILDSSDMPDKENGNVILAAHSGNSKVSYFKNLDKLKIDDMVYIDYDNKTYNYKVVNIYDIEKTGKAKIIRNQNTNTLTLITCKEKTNKQIVIICELII